MLPFLYLYVLFTSIVWAKPLTRIRSNGVTYNGIRDSTGQAHFKGIPFGQPPTGKYRFAAPRAIKSMPKVWNATSSGPECHQITSEQDNQSEDCLSLDVYIPATWKKGESLPVIFWIYGGSFKTGANSRAHPVGLLETGDKYGQRAIWVSVNYRLNAWGWLVGTQAQAAGLSNVGLLDQRLGMEWVQKNIRNFGGNPNRVILAGQSAGAVSVGAHLLRPQGTGGLYHAAVLMSGTASTIGIGPPALRQDVFDSLLQHTGCTKTRNVFKCLEAIPERKFHQAVYSTVRPYVYAFGPQIDGTNIPGQPNAYVKKKKFAKVPLLLGDVNDEGTITRTAKYNTRAQVVAFIRKYGPSKGYAAKVLNKLLDRYSTKPADGSPYGTGSKTFGLGPLGKQAYSALGDIQFQAPRRLLSQSATGRQSTYGYIFTESSTTPVRGSYHAMDLGYWMGNGRPLSNQMGRYLLNFANTFNPNGKSLPHWPTYGRKGVLMHFQTDEVKQVKDNFRANQIAYINENPDAFFS